MLPPPFWYLSEVNTLKHNCPAASSLAASALLVYILSPLLPLATDGRDWKDWVK
jgi:hypothetical protein